MCFKKNAFSYFCWGLMILMVGAIVSYWGMLASQLFAKGNFLVAVGCCALFFGAVYLIYLLVGVVLKYTTVVNSHYINNNTSVIEELIIVSLLMVAFLTVRVYLLSILTVDTAYYNAVQVAGDGKLSTLFVQGSTYYYCTLLHSCFKLFGNHIVIGVWLQIILQVISVLLFYMAIRTLGGKVAAILYLTVVCFSSTSIDAGLEYSPQMLYLCLFGLVFYLCTIYLSKVGESLNSVKMWICTVCLGLAIGFVCYVDVTGIVLLLLMICLCTVKCDWFWARYRYLHMGGIFLAAVAMFLLTIFADAMLCGAKFGNVLNAWFAVYSDFSVNIGDIVKKYSREFIILPTFIALGIFSFWRRKKEQYFAPFIIMVTGMSLLYFLGVPGQNMDGNYLLYLLMTALAGISVSELFYGPELLVVKANSEEAEVVEVTEAKPEIEKIVENEEFKTASREEAPVTAEVVEKEMEETEMEKRFERKQEETNKIENPLPIPKKKEKKIMDYAFQPESFEMMYDIRVSEKDDFDV